MDKVAACVHEREGMVAVEGIPVELVLDTEDDDREYAEEQLPYLLVD